MVIVHGDVSAAGRAQRTGDDALRMRQVIEAIGASTVAPLDDSHREQPNPVFRFALGRGHVGALGDKARAGGDKGEIARHGGEGIGLSPPAAMLNKFRGTFRVALEPRDEGPMADRVSRSAGRRLNAV